MLETAPVCRRSVRRGWRPWNRRNRVSTLCLLPADLHVRRLARLGGPHVALPGHSALVFKLPHCQVKTLANFNGGRGHVAAAAAAFARLNRPNLFKRTSLSPSSCVAEVGGSSGASCPRSRNPWYGPLPASVSGGNAANL